MGMGMGMGHRRTLLQETLDFGRVVSIARDK